MALPETDMPFTKKNGIFNPIIKSNSIICQIKKELFIKVISQ